MFTSVNSRAATAYQRVAVETSVQGADPHHLVTMLYDGLLRSLQLARSAMDRQDVAAKGQALGKASRILDEGLKAGLNLSEGGELAQNLRNLYVYCTQRLMQANLRNDLAAVDEVIGLIDPLADSWKKIRNAALQGG